MDVRRANPDAAETGWRGAAPALLLLLLSVAGLAALSLRPPEGGPVAALFPPGFGFAEAAAAVGAAGGAVVRPGAFANLVVAASDAPGFAAALRRAGAVALFDPRVLGGCLAPPPAS